MQQVGKETGVRWGRQGAPLLPESLRRQWAEVQLPKWVTSDVSLPTGATMADLGPGCTVPNGASFDRVQAFLCQELANRVSELHSVPAVGHPWPAELDPATIPWRVRTRNRLANGRILDRLDLIEVITFGDLARVQQLGPVGILDFLCTLEAAEHRLGVRRPANDMATAVNEITNEQTSPRDTEVSQIIVDALDQDWIDKVGRYDPRFADLVPPINGTLFEAIDELTSGIQTGHDAFALMDSIAAAVPKLNERAQRIQALTIEDALRELIAFLLRRSDSRVDAVVARLQWNGNPKPLTLEAAGSLVGVTRERIRQLELRIRNALRNGRYYLPQVDHALRLLAEQAPTTLRAAAHALQRAGISRTAFHPQSLMAVATDLRRTLLVQIDERKGREAVVREPINPAADRVIEAAFRQLGQVGITNISEVSMELEASGVTVANEEIGEIVGLYGGAVFVQEGWFWCPDRPNSNLVTQARKMLSVVSPLDVATLREGLKRASRFRRISGRQKQALVVPTRSALLEYLSRHPEFVVGADSMVRYARALDHRKELPPSEQIMVQALSTSPTGILERAAFQDACVSRGLNRNTWAVLTSYSPILQSLGGGLWTLRGRHVDPAAVEVLRQMTSERPREKRLVDYGWTSTGHLWMATRLPANPTELLSHVPSPIRRYLTAQMYIARTERGVDCGQVKIYDNSVSAGYGPFLRQAGGDEGDILLAQFDLANSCVLLRLIDDELLEEFANLALMPAERTTGAML